MKIYICHYVKLKNRIDYLLPELNKNGFSDIEVIYGIDRDNIPPSELEKFTNDPIHMEARRQYGYPHPYDIFAPKEKGVIANFLTHIKIWEKIANGEEEWALVLEDDARVDTNYIKLWNKLIETIPADMDIAYLHDGCGFTVEGKLGIKTTPGKFWYPCAVKESRTCCSYMISRQTCQTYLSALYPIVLGVDHELNYLQKKYQSNVYWTSPCIFNEGSGMFYASNMRPPTKI